MICAEAVPWRNGEVFRWRDEYGRGHKAKHRGQGEVSEVESTVKFYDLNLADCSVRPNNSDSTSLHETKEDIQFLDSLLIKNFEFMEPSEGGSGARGASVDDISSPPLEPQSRGNGDGNQGPPEIVNPQVGRMVVKRQSGMVVKRQSGMVVKRQRREPVRQKKTHECPLLGKRCPFAPDGRFPNAAKVKEDSQRHINGFQCRNCGKRFGKKYGLIRHKRNKKPCKTTEFTPVHSKLSGCLKRLEKANGYRRIREIMHKCRPYIPWDEITKRSRGKGAQDHNELEPSDPASQSSDGPYKSDDMTIGQSTPQPLAASECAEGGRGEGSSGVGYIYNGPNNQPVAGAQENSFSPSFGTPINNNGNFALGQNFPGHNYPLLETATGGLRGLQLTARNSDMTAIDPQLLSMESTELPGSPQGTESPDDDTTDGQSTSQDLATMRVSEFASEQQRGVQMSSGGVRGQDSSGKGNWSYADAAISSNNDIYQSHQVVIGVQGDSSAPAAGRSLIGPQINSHEIYGLMGPQINSHGIYGQNVLPIVSRTCPPNYVSAAPYYNDTTNPNAGSYLQNCNLAYPHDPAGSTTGQNLPQRPYYQQRVVHDSGMPISHGDFTEAPGLELDELPEVTTAETTREEKYFRSPDEGNDWVKEVVEARVRV